MGSLDRVKRSETAPLISKILGTYHWVWCDHPEADKAITRASQEEWGDLTLSLQPEKRAAELENVVRVSQQCMTGVSFEGLVPRTGDDSAGTWDIKSAEWTQGNMPEDGHQPWVTKELEDNGHPFVGMWVNEGRSGCCPTGCQMLAQHQRKGYVPGKGRGWDELSEAELRRLGLPGGGESGEEDSDEAEEHKEDESDEDADGEEEDGEEDVDELKKRTRRRIKTEGRMKEEVKVEDKTIPGIPEITKKEEDGTETSVPSKRKASDAEFWTGSRYN
ncbi:hypothetical protein LshimejAT787_0310700 [Lyophyllum shimeji]|uniref:Uncharacterized protein n=1 Tax=Lyophyllum shimeji TaxID=47721 RepID=A0A9P3PJU4_LYOSH|nr:hypothetical protein LshimejAT787_0310700 [Lyophyllum shimeji]